MYVAIKRKTSCMADLTELSLLSTLFVDTAGSQ